VRDATPEEKKSAAIAKRKYSNIREEKKQSE